MRRLKGVIRGHPKDSGEESDDPGTDVARSFAPRASPSKRPPALSSMSSPTGEPGRIPMLEDSDSGPQSASSGAIFENTEASRGSSTPSAVSWRSSQVSRLLTFGFGLRSTSPSASTSMSADSVPGASDLGLHLIHNVAQPAADLILVHGLGGSWLKTWSWKHDPKVFWPSWLPSEDGLARVRIFSFGYNANFKGAQTNLGILDFAKDLLHKMSGFGGEDDKIGRKPIIFVAHSMGGLVVKKAYVLGTLDDVYADMISRVFGIIFLATPHRGSNYARTLNKVLSASMVTNAKVYVAELEGMSPTLRDISEQFRLVCKPLRIVSFYESLKTMVGGSKVMVVERDSGVLGYPSEISAPMDADHHNVSKFSNPEDPNYVALRGVIRDIVRKSASSDSGTTDEKSCAQQSPPTDVNEVISTLTKLLGVHEAVDLSKYRGMDGTCDWIHTRDYYTKWAESSQDTLRVLWLTSLPGMGKSTLARAIVNSLRGDEESDGTYPGCQYHFFSFSDVAKRKASYALRCIAFQLALEHKGLRRHLCQLYDATGLSLEQQDVQVVWTRIYEGVILKTVFDKPLYWVLDGLDESDSPAVLVSYIFRSKPKSPIRIFLTSRPTSTLVNLASSQREFLRHVPLSTSDTKHDIKLLIWTTLQDTIPTSQTMRDSIAEQMYTKASGSFVWVKLALKTLERAWHTEEDIQNALNDMPLGMLALFDRMASGIDAMKEDSPRNHALALRILAWVACSAEPLTTAQLAAALEPEFTKLQNLEATILHLCGLFIMTSEGRVMPIHETAKSFLLGAHIKKHGDSTKSPFLDSERSHEHLATVCLNYLSNDKWRNVLLEIQEEGSARTRMVSKNRLELFLCDHPFLPYAVSQWAYHVNRADRDSQDLTDLLQEFFDHNLLSWIHACVVLKDLRVVTRAAEYIKAYGRKRKPRSLLESTASPSRDDADYFRLWAIDLMRVVGRFGRNLAEKPSSIYKTVPPLCPRGSKMFKTYGSRGTLSIKGISSNSWDDCLARLPIGEERTISRVLSTVIYFICLVAVNGEIIICYAETCEEARRMVHGEYVPHMTLSKSGALLATAGIETFRIWEVVSGAELYRFPRPESALVMTLSFGPLEELLLVGYDNCMVTTYSTESGSAVSDFLAEEEDDGDYHPCPRAMILSPDTTKLAIVFRGRPVLIWDTKSREERPIQCIREGDLAKRSSDAWGQVDSIIWHPDGLSVFVLYQDATIVCFYLIDEPTVECHETSAREMVINNDGHLLLTSDNAGTLSLWSLPQFQLMCRLPHEDLVRDLVFSPDSQRFYDVRGAICNIWEPEVLLRAGDDDAEDPSATEKYDTAVSDPVYSTDSNARSEITTIARGPGDKYCVCGKEDGAVTIYDATDGSKIRKVYNHSSSGAVIALSWSLTGKYIASSDDNGRVLTKRLEAKDEEGKWAVFPCLDFRNQESVRQFIFNRSEKLMLASSAASDMVWNLKAKTQIWSRDRDQSLGLRSWINHPLQRNLLLCFHPNKSTVHDWQPASNQSSSDEPYRTSISCAHSFPSSGKSSPTSPIGPSSSGSSTPRVRRVALSESRKCVVVEVLPGISEHTKLGGKALRLEVLWAEELQAKSVMTKSLDRDHLEDVSRSVRRFLGCYKDHIVFLNHEYWVCTWPLGGSSATPIKRHFFLPRDCASPSSLPLVTLAEPGSVLFPRNGELAVVQGGLRL